MKKKGLFLVFAVIVAVSVLSVYATACTGTDGETFVRFTVNFYSEGQLVEAVTVDSADFDFASAIPDAPDKSGEEGDYVFLYWRFKDGTPLTENNYPTTDADLFAVYEFAGKTYTVTFKGYDGSYLEVNGKYSQKVIEGKAAVAPVPPEVEGFEFVGWDKALDCVKENLTVNAVYEKKTYTLSFKDGDKVIKSEKVAFGSSLNEYEVEKPEREGLTFIEWKSEDGRVYYDMPAKNLTMVAVWKVNTPEGISLIASSENAVYGDAVTLALSFTEYEDIEYSVRWLVDGAVAEGDGDAFVLKKGAGRYRVKANVSASYGDATSSVSSNEITVYIAKKELEVTPAVYPLVYGEAYEPDFVYDGFVNGEDETVLKGSIYVSTAYVQGSDVGSYYVSAGGISAENYEIKTQTVTLNVEKRPLKVEVVSAKVTYGDPFVPSEYRVRGLYGDDVVGEVALYCPYPSVNVNAGEYDITASGVVFKKGKAENYAVEYVESTLTVNQKAVTVELLNASDITYLDEAPAFSYTVNGLVNGDGESALGTVSTVCDYSAGDGVGEYSAYLNIKGESLNYDVTLSATQQAPATFNVLPYVIKFEGVATKDNRYGEDLWISPVDKFVTGLPNGFIATGTVKALTNETGDYTLPGDEDKFEYTLFVLNSEEEDCTDNFDVVCSFELKVGAIADMTVQNYVYDYNGSPQGDGVEIHADGYYAEYLDGDGEYVSYHPTFTDAGEYTVSFRVVDGFNDVVASSSYKVSINKIVNVIDCDGVIDEYVYNGVEQTVSGAVALYEEAAVTYENNTFTDVPDGGVLTVTAIAAETKNYKETRVSFTVTVNKADYTEEQIPELEIEVQAEPGKTLEGIAAPENCTWHNAAAVSLVVGEQSADALYCADSRNYNAKRVSVKVVGIKTAIAIVSSDVSVPFGTDYAPQYSFTKNSVAFDPSTVGLTLTVTADTTTFAVGSTYKVTLSLDDNDWYAAHDKTVTVKVPTVLYGGAYYTIEDALKLVQSNESFIIVAYDTSFATPDAAADVYADDSYYTLSSGENLLVPYSEAHSTNAFDYAAGKVVKNNAYATLYIPTGITFRSSGYTYVAAARNVGSAQPTGNTSGKYGVLNIAEGAKFVSDGTFECLGYSVGDGLVEITAGNLYEPMIAIGYKGGNITYAIRNEVFPISQYTVNNIIADMKIYSGVSYYAKAAVGASGDEIPSDVKFFGNSSGVFMSLQSGYMTKSYDEDTGVVRFDVYGDIVFNNMSITLESPFGEVTVSTSKKQVPLPGYFDFGIKSGSTATVNAGVKLLPGASFTIDEGATLNVNKDIFVYSAFEGYVTLDKESDKFEGTTLYQGWQDGGNGMTYPVSAYRTENYYYTDVAFDFNGTTPAAFTVKGTLNVASGGTIAGGFVLEGNGKIIVNGSANVSNTIKEDLSNYADKILGLTVRGRYFTATSSAYYVCGGKEVALEKGRTYTCNGSGVTVS